MTDNKMNPEEKKKVRNASHRYGRKAWKNGSRDFGTMLDYAKADFTAGAEYGYDLAMERLKDVWDQACEDQKGINDSINPSRSQYSEPEIWRVVDDYPLYEVSSMGQVRRKYKNGRVNFLKQKPNRSGYINIGLCVNGQKYYSFAHTLVAKAFIPNTNNKCHVNHKNGIPDDNRVDNLEWATASENLRHSYEKLGRINYYKGKSGVSHPCSLKTYQFTKDGQLIAEYDSVRLAAKAINRYASQISKACAGSIKQAYGYRWSHEFKLTEKE